MAPTSPVSPRQAGSQLWCRRVDVPRRRWPLVQFFLQRCARLFHCRRRICYSGAVWRRRLFPRCPVAEHSAGRHPSGMWSVEGLNCDGGSTPRALSRRMSRTLCACRSSARRTTSPSSRTGLRTRCPSRRRILSSPSAPRPFSSRLRLTPSRRLPPPEMRIRRGPCQRTSSTTPAGPRRTSLTRICRRVEGGGWPPARDSPQCLASLPARSRPGAASADAGAIAGGVIGGLAGVALIAGIAWYVLRARRASGSLPTTNDGAAAAPAQPAPPATAKAPVIANNPLAVPAAASPALNSTPNWS